MNTHTQTAIDSYLDAKGKSPAMAFLLALIAGPLGAMYGSPSGGAVLLLAAIIGALTSGPFIPILTWIISLIYAPSAASAHNDRLKAEAQLILAVRQTRD